MLLRAAKSALGHVAEDTIDRTEAAWAVFGKGGSMSFVRTYLFCCSTSLLTLACMNDVALAQSAPVDEPGEIVVTAQRRTQSLQDVPVSASVVDGSVLQNNAINSLEDLAVKIPTVKFGQASQTDQINIRGFGSGANIGFEQAVATFVDGTYRNRAISRRLALFDAERIEILKGPQTIFFGANATAGAFSITTRKPVVGDPLAVNGSVYFEPRYNTLTMEGGASLPVTDTLAVRFAVNLDSTDGYSRDFLTRQRKGGVSDVIGRGIAVWHPSSNFRTTLRFDAGSNDHKGDPATEVVGCRTDPLFGIAPRGLCATYLASGIPVDDKLDYRSLAANTFFKAHFKELESSTEFDIGPGTLVATTSLYRHTADRLSDVIPVPIPNTLGERGLFPVRTFERYEQWTQELRYQGKAGIFDYTFGGYYLEGKLKVDTFFGLLSVRTLPLGTGYLLHLDQKQIMRSGFGAVDAHITDAATISLGLRYSESEKRASRAPTIGSTTTIPSFATFQPYSLAQQQALTTAVGVNLADFADPHRKDNGFMPSVTLQYQLDPRITSYAKFVKGFKGGGYALTGGRSTFDKEEVEAYELGIKANLPGLFIALATYQNKFDNLQEAGNTVNPATGAVESFVDNVGAAKSRGVELSINARPTSQLRINAELAYLDAKYTSYVGATCDSITQALTGRRVCDLSGRTRPYSPKWSGSFGFNYSHDVGQLRLFADPSVEISSKYYTLATLDPVALQSGYAKYNLRLGITNPQQGWTLAVVGKNLSNRITSDARNLLSSAPGSAYAIPNPPRTIGIQLLYSGGQR